MPPLKQFCISTFFLKHTFSKFKEPLQCLCRVINISSIPKGKEGTLNELSLDFGRETLVASHRFRIIR